MNEIIVKSLSLCVSVEVGKAEEISQEEQKCTRVTIPVVEIVPTFSVVLNWMIWLAMLLM